MVCHEEDTFNLRECLFIAIAKHLYKGIYTCEGVEYKSRELKYLKKYVKIVDIALKNYNKKLEEEKKEIEAAKAIERKKAKNARRKARHKVNRRARRVAEMKEAYLAALKEYGILGTFEPVKILDIKLLDDAK
jgi:hypothetical protein